ncbi:hypothetical protein Tco_0978806 [Tanacetum coccineum]|uniref:Retrotransposon gag domain-containing protein n=1 Tax=Tanacetum coccineum TaxID=301880 RepID=A0ABQ5EPA5_9ASTR
MSTPTHPIIIISDSDVKDAFSSTGYISASPDYSPASPGNTSSDSKTESDPSEDLFEDRSAPLAITPFPNDLYIQIRRVYYDTNEESSDSLSPSTILPPPAPTAAAQQPTILTLMTRLERHKEQIDTILNHLDEFPIERIEQIEYGIEGLVYGRVIIQGDFDRLETELQEARTQITGFQREQIKHDDEIVLTRVTMALLPLVFLEPLYQDIMAMVNAQDIEHIIQPMPPRDTDPPIGSPIPSSPSSSVGSSSPVRSTIPPPDYPFDESIFAELDNSLNTREGETPVARKCSYKEFKSCQPSHFKGTERAISLIRWFERTESVFLSNNCTEDSKVKFAIGTLTEDALSWWNLFAQPIRIEEAYKTTWSELKKLLTKKYCPRTEVKKIEDEFYSPTVKGNDLKTYVRRF